MKEYTRTTIFFSLAAIHCIVILAPYHAFAQLADYTKSETLPSSYQSSFKNYEEIPGEQEEGNAFIMIHWNAGLFMFQKNNGNLDVGFPYMSRELSSGTITQQNYQSGLEDPFGKNTFLVDLISMAYGTTKSFYTAGVGLVTNYDGRYFDLGYGYNFFVPRFDGDEQNNFLILRPEIALYHYQFRAKEFEKIYNNESDLKMLGYYANYNFNAPWGFGTRAAESDHVNVQFVQGTTSAVPGLTISTNPFLRKLNWGITCSWFIPFTSKGGLQLIQEDREKNYQLSLTGHQGGFKSIPFSHTDLTATLDNKKLSGSPFSFSGFYAGVDFGIRLHWRTTQ